MLELSYVVYACIMNNTMWKLETYIYCKLDIHCLIYVYIYILLLLLQLLLLLLLLFLYTLLWKCA